MRDILPPSPKMVNHGKPSIIAQDENWHILGAGAMGCLWAAHLWLALDLPSVSESRRPLPAFLLRSSDDLRRYRTLGGVTLERDGRSICCRIPATSLQKDGKPLRRLLLATKAQDAMTALAGVESRLTSSTTVVLLQNGVKTHREIARQYPKLQIYSAVTSHGAYLRAPYHVVQAGLGQVWLGQLQSSKGQSSAEPAHISELLGTLPAQAMNIHHAPDIEARLWHKFAINCAINPLTVLHDCRNGELLTRPAAFLELTALCREIENLFSVIPGTPPLNDLLEQVTGVLRTTAFNYSSMLQDVRKGRTTEIFHLNHYLCELAHNLGETCPVNEDVLRRFAAYSSSVS